jgi:hypothetical protein
VAGTGQPGGGALGKLYIADPTREGPVTGGPFRNFVEIEGPIGAVLDPANIAAPHIIRTENFALMGRLYQGQIGGQVNVNRASYASSLTGNKLDVFATGLPTTQGRLPASPTPLSVTPALSFFEAPCGVDAAGGLTAPGGAAKVQMFSSGSNHWGQSLPAALPLAVCVEDSAARSASGQVVPTYIEKAVTDQVFISEASYNPGNGGSLTITAASSDLVTPPVLSAVGFGDLVNGQLVVMPLSAPPSTVRVQSSAGGINRFQVTTGVGGAPNPAVPVAVNDSFTFAEDSGAQVLNVLANDLNAAGGTVTIQNQSRLGSVLVNADGTVGYTPNLNASGIDGFTYTVTVAGVMSNAGSVSINLTLLNDAPVAVDDSFQAVSGVASDINVFSNDTDVDGAADLVNAVLVTGPAAGATVTGGTGGVFNFAATAAGTYMFTYQAQDAAGALSNTATVTVTVAPQEIIAITPPVLFRTAKLRWRVAGTDSVIAGQLVTISLANGTAAGTVIGTAVVDAAGNWAFDIVGATGNLDPRTTGATRINVTSPLGGSAAANIQIRQ